MISFTLDLIQEVNNNLINQYWLNIHLLCFFFHTFMIHLILVWVNQFVLFLNFIPCHHEILCIILWLVFLPRAQEIKEHSFFKGLDWVQVYLQKYSPPLIPPKGEVNAADAFDIGSFDEEDTKGIKVVESFLIKFI